MFFGNENYIIANIAHPYFGRIGTIEGDPYENPKHLLFHSRESLDPEIIIVGISDIRRLA